MARPNLKQSMKLVDRDGVLLVYPIDNRKEPPSLWSRLYPRTAMRWEWDDEGDSRVADLWRMREELARSNVVVYAKWYQGRATFFSKEIFRAYLSVIHEQAPDPMRLSPTAREILEILEMDSPLSTKELKAAADLQGKSFQTVWDRALKELWRGLWIVGFGEKDDGAFPSLLMGATKTLFEEVWTESTKLLTKEAWNLIQTRLPASSPFVVQLKKQLKK